MNRYPRTAYPTRLSHPHERQAISPPPPVHSQPADKGDTPKVRFRP